MKIKLNLNNMLSKSLQTVHIEQNWIHSKNKIIKNLLIIGFAWILLFTGKKFLNLLSMKKLSRIKKKQLSNQWQIYNQV